MTIISKVLGVAFSTSSKLTNLLFSFDWLGSSLTKTDPLVTFFNFLSARGKARALLHLTKLELCWKLIYFLLKILLSFVDKSSTFVEDFSNFAFCWKIFYLCWKFCLVLLKLFTILTLDGFVACILSMFKGCLLSFLPHLVSFNLFFQSFLPPYLSFMLLLVSF